METLINVLKAASDRNRVRILKMLQNKNMCVCELASVLGIRQPSVSRHLKKLKDAGIIDCRQEGFWSEYFISASNDFAADIITGLRGKLNDDPQIQNDLKLAKMTNREKLCCRAEKA